MGESGTPTERAWIEARLVIALATGDGLELSELEIDLRPAFLDADRSPRHAAD